MSHEDLEMLVKLTQENGGIDWAALHSAFPDHPALGHPPFGDQFLGMLNFGNVAVGPVVGPRDNKASWQAFGFAVYLEMHKPADGGQSYARLWATGPDQRGRQGPEATQLQLF